MDAIIATGDPFVLFSYAAKLSKEFGIPWLADYRDPWSHDQRFFKNMPIRSWNSFLEKKIVSSASHISTVSPDHVLQQGRLIMYFNSPT